MLLRKLSQDQKTMFENLVMNLKNNVLGFSQIHIPYFTAHGVQHADGVIEQLSNMIPNEVLKEMDDIEVFILLCSAWLHDIGLLVNVDKNGKRLSNEEVRDRHHELSRDLIMKKHNQLGLVDSRAAEIVAEVCYCHRRRVNLDTYFPSEEITFDGSKVRVQFLSALLRLADAMDTGSKRAPRVLMGDILELPENEKRHWRACQLISGIDYAAERLSIIIDSRYKGDEERKLALWKFKDLYKEFLPIRDLLIKNGLNYSDLIDRLFNVITREPPEVISGNRYFRRIMITWKDLQKRANKLTEATLGTGTIRQKYDRGLFLARKEIEQEFTKFLKSDKVGFAITGDTGSGKTSLICNLAEQYRLKNVVLLYNCPSLPHLDIERKIFEDLSPSPEFRMSTFLDELLEEISEKAREKENRNFIVFIDAINEVDDSKQLLKNINEMIAHVSCPHVKIVISCRTIIWNTLLLLRDFLYRTKFYTFRGKEEVRLAEFNDEELEKAYELYRKQYKLESEFQHLSQKAKDVCRVPLMLRFISETYEGKKIPPYVPLELVFNEYCKKFVESDMEVLLGKIVYKMHNLKTDHIARRKLAEDAFIAKHMADSTPSSAYVKLLDRGILTESPFGEVKFLRDRFFEFLLARRILEEPLEEDRCLSLIKQASTFNSLWGAIKTAIFLKGDLELTKKLATYDDYDVRQVLIDTFKTLSIRDWDKIYSLMKDILSSDSVASKRLAVLASCEIIPCPADLLVSAMLDKNVEIRGLAIQHTYMLWRKNPEEGRKVIKEICSFGLKDIMVNRRAFLASLELQARIFLNHTKEKDAILLVDSLSLDRVRTFTRKPLIGNIAFRLGARFAKRIVTKMWKLEYDLWISPFFKASQEEREKMRLLIPYLNVEEKLSPEIERILYEAAGSDLSAVAAMASIVLIIQGRALPESVLSIIKKLITSRDERRVHVALKVLAFMSKVLVSELETEFDTASEIIYGDPRFHKWIGEFGLNMCEQQKGKIDFIEKIIKKAIDERNLKVLEITVADLGNIGVRFPINSLLTLADVFAFDYEPLQEVLIESLAKIRALYPDKVDKYLKDEHPNLLNEVQRTSAVPPYLELYGMSSFFLDVVIASSLMRPLAADFIEKFTQIRNEKDFQKLLSYGLKKSIDWWMHRKNVKAYLEWVEQIS